MVGSWEGRAIAGKQQQRWQAKVSGINLPVLNTHTYNPHHILVKIQAAYKIVSCVSPSHCKHFCDVVLSMLKVIFSREFPSLWWLQKFLQAFGLKNIGYEISSCKMLLFPLVLFNCLYLVYPHLFLFSCLRSNFHYVFPSCEFNYKLPVLEISLQNETLYSSLSSIV